MTSITLKKTPELLLTNNTTNNKGGNEQPEIAFGCDPPVSNGTDNPSYQYWDKDETNLDRCDQEAMAR